MSETTETTDDIPTENCGKFVSLQSFIISTQVVLPIFQTTTYYISTYFFDGLGNGGASSNSSNAGTFASQLQVACPPPKSPARTIVRAYLGDHGHTFVPTKPGSTVRDALSKAMKLRKLVPETCAVYRCSDPHKVM